MIRQLKHRLAAERIVALCLASLECEFVDGHPRLLEYTMEPIRCPRSRTRSTLEVEPRLQGAHAFELRMQ